MRERFGDFAARGFHDINAKAFVPVVAVSERNGAGFPATTVVATWKSADGVEKLMVRVGFPMARLAPTSDDNAGAVLRAIWSDGDCCGQVHDSGDRAEHARAVINEADELADAGLFPQIDDASQCGMMVAFCPDLRKEDAPLEMIDDGLPALSGPPFDGDVVLSACGDNPIRHIGPDYLGNLRGPRFFDRVKVDIALEQARADLHAELVGEVLGKAVDAVPRAGVALVEQRIVALDDAPFIFAHRRDVGIVQPKIVERRAEVCEVTARIRSVQFADCCGEKRDVAE